MTIDPRIPITEILTRLEGQGLQGPAAEELLPAVYDELRKLAGSYMRRERKDHTLQTTGLVHEAYLRLVDQKRVHWKGRGHFFATAAQMMRRILVEDARSHKRIKRGGEWKRIILDESITPLFKKGLNREEILGLDRALDELRELDERQADVVELRFFTGLGVSEVAEILGVSKRTVEGDWTHAKAWLKRALS